VDEEGGDLGEARGLGGLQAPLAGDEEDGAALLDADQDGLEDALVPDRLGQLREALLVEVLAGLVGVRLDVSDGKGVQPALLVNRGRRFLISHGALLPFFRTSNGGVEQTLILVPGTGIIPAGNR